jgi:hypothetical protein
METFASPPRRTIYTVIFRGEGGCKPEPSPDRNRRNGEKAGKINTCVSRRGFKKFISPVEDCEHHIQVVYESQTMFLGRCPGNNTFSANCFLRVDKRDDQFAQNKFSQMSMHGTCQICSGRESGEPAGK